MGSVRFAVRWPVLVLGIFACANRDAPLGSAWSVDSAQVIFTGTRAGSTDIYIAYPGVRPTRLTQDPARDNYARLAPDGRTLAFQSGRSGAIDIYLMDLTSGEVVNLTDHPAYDVLPAWSPNGQHLAFMSTRGFELGGQDGPFPGHLYIVDSEGVHLQQITGTPLTSSLGPQDWTPDGEGILLSRELDGSLDIFLLDVATGNETRLTSEPADEYGGAFSRDGSRIAFHAEANGVSSIVIMRRDGANRRTVTPGPGLRYSPRWSPDDAWLLYTVQGTGESDYDLEAVHVEDGTIVPIVVTSEDEREGDWVTNNSTRITAQ